MTMMFDLALMMYHQRTFHYKEMTILKPHRHHYIERLI